MHYRISRVSCLDGILDNPSVHVSLISCNTRRLSPVLHPVSSNNVHHHTFHIRHCYMQIRMRCWPAAAGVIPVSLPLSPSFL